MNGPEHRWLAAACQASASIITDQPMWQRPISIALAVVFSGGFTSPDIDNTKLWKKLDKWVPDEWLGDGGPLQHRGLTHWWGIPAGGAVAAHVWLAGNPLQFVVQAACLGYGSHIASDAVFGQAGYGTQQGVPLILWFCHVGVGFKSDGAVQHIVLYPVCGLLLWWASGTPGAGYLYVWLHPYLDQLRAMT